VLGSIIHVQGKNDAGGSIKGRAWRSKAPREQLQRRLWCLARRSHFLRSWLEKLSLQAWPAQSKGRSRAEVHCLDPEGSPFDRFDA
jgi:hypothetical protein